MAAPSTVRVAVTQHEPVWLDLDATVDKTIKLIAEAAEAGAALVAFPELWIPGYPAWIWSRPVDFDLNVRYAAASLAVDSPQFKRILAAASEHHIAVSLGFSERANTSRSGSSLYISQALISSSGDLLVKRRKFKPTHMERTVFGDASGDCLSSLPVLDGIGKVGSLSCWEHIQPLLKFWTFSQGEEVHVAAWPVLGACPEGDQPGFWSMGDEGCRTMSRAYAVEAQCFVLHCTTVLGAEGVKSMGTEGAPLMGAPQKGSSAVFAPDGRMVAEGAGDEKLLVVDLNMELITKAKSFADASGHYSRPDLLWLGADTKVKSVRREE